MSVLDFLLGGFRPWRRLRGGRWLDVFHVPSCTVVGWVRQGEPRQGEHVNAVEEYRMPRARLLP